MIRLRYNFPSALLFAALMVGCSEVPSAPLPTETAGPVPAGLLSSPARADGRVSTVSELEPFARALAHLMAKAETRVFVANELHRSEIKEQKVELKSLLWQMLHSPESTLDTSEHQAVEALYATAEQYTPIEVYIPFAEQRAVWMGEGAVQVVTLVDDDDEPVAFQSNSQRSVLARRVRPSMVTLVVTPAEQSFAPRGVARAICDPEVSDCGGGDGGGGGGGGNPPADTSLYMTRLKINDDYESMFKGDPEFEVHILGPVGTSDSVTTLQCTGEHAGGPYAFDYNNTSSAWTGSVLLFSKSQLAAFRSSHPNKAFRVFVVEDDDDSCVLRMDKTEVVALFTALGTAYSGVDAAIDTSFSIPNVVKAGNAVYNFIAAAASFITSKDDLVGTSLEDSVVGQYFTDANWIIRGPGNSTKGYMKLVMKP